MKESRLTVIALLLFAVAGSVLSDCPATPTCGSLDWGVHKPYPPDCTMYIFCNMDGSASLLKCPETQHFSPTESMCTSPELAACPDCIVGTTVEPTISPCKPTPSCVGMIEGVKLPYPPDCTKFLYCLGYDDHVIFDCMGGFHFSPTTNLCMPPEEAGCPYCIELTTATPAINF